MGKYYNLSLIHILATVFIPMNADFSNKKYKKPKAFKNISSLSKDDFFTFEEGDIIVKGICDFEFCLLYTSRCV